MNQRDPRPPSRRRRREPESVAESLARHNERVGIRDTLRAQGRSRRERPAKPALSREVILDTALAILDREGVDALSMRRVAQELDTGAASLYVYVANRDDLLGSLVDRIAVALPLPTDDSAPWQQRVKTVLLDSMAALRAHPGLARVAQEVLPGDRHQLLVTEEGQHRLTDYMIGCLREGGLSDQRIAWVLDFLSMLVISMSVERDEIEQRIMRAESWQMESWFGGILDEMPLERFPSIAIFPYFLSMGELSDRLGWFIDVVLAGANQVPLPPGSDAPHPMEDVFRERLGWVPGTGEAR